jgi:hypothetical protein
MLAASELEGREERKEWPMTRSMRPRSVAAFALISASLVILVLAAMAPGLLVVEVQAKRPAPTPTATAPKPDFRLDYANYGYTDIGYVVRGGLPSCGNCSDDWEPRFVDRNEQGCFYGSNQFTLTSLNGFEGVVYIGASSIAPKGVTSEMAPSVFVPRDQTVLVPFKLKAAMDASGFGLVLVQAIGKGGTTPTHSIYHEVWVADALPPCQ